MIVPSFVEEHAAPYHFDHIETFLGRVDVDGKRVLEIGSDYFLASARLIRANGAAEVVSTNLTDWRSPDPLPEGIQFRVVDASATGIADDSFDLIYGIAVLEHIPDMQRMCHEMRRLLRPGGKAFLEGCPFWSCSVGHHVRYAKQERVVYSFTDDTNPIANWSHLVLSPTEMAEELESQGICAEDAAGISQFVYGMGETSTQTPHSAGSPSNQLLPSEALSCLSRHFCLDIVKRYRDGAPENEYYTRAKREYGEGDLRTMGFSVVLET